MADGGLGPGSASEFLLRNRLHLEVYSVTSYSMHTS
jgi:hypothetical protein